MLSKNLIRSFDNWYLLVRSNVASLPTRIISSRFSSTNVKCKFLIVNQRGKNKNIGFIQLNRPQALNALCEEMMSELSATLINFEDDKNVRVAVITGNEKAFAAGADIKEMQKLKFSDAYMHRFLKNWKQVSVFTKPIIAAVNGFALGGGCELAMMCDVIYAGTEAQFGQPEVLIGTIPGLGGSQRLSRTIGKYKAMELCMSGEKMSADDAEKAGLVAKVFPVNRLVDETIKYADKVALNSIVTLKMLKESVLASLNLPLVQGLQFERSTFYQTFATHDQKEGMTAFVEKRKPEFKDS